MAKRKFLIEEFLPHTEVSLIAGPSGGGKTTWTFQTLERWLKGEPILNRKSYPSPCVYVSLDRSYDAAEATLERMGISLPIPIISAVDKNISTLEAVIQAARDAEPHAKLLILDGFARLVPGSKTNDYGEVAHFLSACTRRCKKEDITILGLVHAAKTKENERYTNPRERILGSVAWAGFTETIIFISSTDPDDVECKYRMLEILSRQSAGIKQELEFHEGRLIPSTRKQEMEFKITSFLDAFPFGVVFSSEEFAATIGIKKTRAYEILNRLIETKAVEKVGHGKYTRRPDSLPI